VIVDPPLLVGAVNDTLMLVELTLLADMPVGAPGTAAAVTLLLAWLEVLVPTIFVALAVNV
jgi:hypothetical protein